MIDQIIEQPRNQRHDLRPRRRIGNHVVGDTKSEKCAEVLIARRIADPGVSSSIAGRAHIRSVRGLLLDDAREIL